MPAMMSLKKLTLTCQRAFIQCAVCEQIACEIRAQFVSSQGQTPQRLSSLMSVLEEKFDCLFSHQDDFTVVESVI